MSLTVGDLVRRTARALSEAGIDGAGREARMLVAEATGRKADRLTLETSEAAEPEQEVRLSRFIAERARRVPISHIIGRRQFFDHEFLVTGDVLDPRPETECLVREALAGPVARVLDLGTGSGAIAISVLAACPDAAGVATDISARALAVAGRNAERVGVSDRLTLIESDWFAAVEGRFDLIVSNPPYIAEAEMAGLAPELAHEPRQALTDGGDGLAAYRAIANGARAYLRPGGRLILEIGWRQGAEVSQLLDEAGLQEIRILPDLDGRDRVVTAKNM